MFVSWFIFSGLSSIYLLYSPQFAFFSLSSVLIFSLDTTKLRLNWQVVRLKLVQRLSCEAPILLTLDHSQVWRAASRSSLHSAVSSWSTIIYCKEDYYLRSLKTRSHWFDILKHLRRREYSRPHSTPDVCWHLLGGESGDASRAAAGATAVMIISIASYL